MAAFTDPNNRNIGRQSLIDTLDDVLFGLRDFLGEDKFPRAASEYLDDWAENLLGRSFVATQSRLANLHSTGEPLLPVAIALMLVDAPRYDIRESSKLRGAWLAPVLVTVGSAVCAVNHFGRDPAQRLRLPSPHAVAHPWEVGELGLLTQDEVTKGAPREICVRHPGT